MSFLEGSVSYGSEYRTAAKAVRISVCQCGPVSVCHVGIGDASLLQRHVVQPLQHACCLVLSSYSGAGPPGLDGHCAPRLPYPNQERTVDVGIQLPSCASSEQPV